MRITLDFLLCYLEDGLCNLSLVVLKVRKKKLAMIKQFQYLVVLHTLAANLSQTCFLIESYAPSFLKLCARDSIAARVADGNGSSEALNFRDAGSAVGSPAMFDCSADVAIALNFACACRGAPRLEMVGIALLESRHAAKSKNDLQCQIQLPNQIREPNLTWYLTVPPFDMGNAELKGRSGSIVR